MENLKFVVFSIVIIFLLGLGGYWAFSTIESGSSHVDKQELKRLKTQNEDLTKQVAQLKNEISLLDTEDKKEVDTETVPEVIPATVTHTTTTSTTTPSTTSTLKYQSLINDLQKLVDSNTSLKKGSKGVAVGYVQKFLNIYNGTSNRIDNDFGVTMDAAVKKFQKAQGLTADGEVGPGTLKKMISCLKSKS